MQGKVIYSVNYCISCQGIVQVSNAVWDLKVLNLKIFAAPISHSYLQIWTHGGETTVSAYTFTLSAVFHMPWEPPRAPYTAQMCLLITNPGGNSLSWDIQAWIAQGLNNHHIALFRDCLQGSSKFLHFYLHSIPPCATNLSFLLSCWCIIISGGCLQSSGCRWEKNAGAVGRHWR